MADYFRKTERGRREVQERSLQLSRAARNLLLIIDGSRSIGTWVGMCQRATLADGVALLEGGLIVALPGPGLAANPAPRPDGEISVGFPIPLPGTNSDPLVTIQSVAGPVLTIWSRVRNASLWGYHIWDSNNFEYSSGDLRNWSMRPGTAPGRVQFANQYTNTCIVPFRFTERGLPFLIHTNCRGQEAADFRLIPLTNGNVAIESMGFKGNCIVARFNNRTESSPYAYKVQLDPCPEAGKVNNEAVWSILPALSQAFHLVAKPQIRPAPPPPPAVDPGTDPGTDTNTTTAAKVAP